MLIIIQTKEEHYQFLSQILTEKNTTEVYAKYNRPDMLKATCHIIAKAHIRTHQIKAS
jgi:hypothetical protein